MSMLLMVKAMQTKVGNPLRKLVLIKLADNANDKGECWPSYQHIADQCEISRRSVINHISALEKMGLLVKESRPGVHKANSSNLYYLVLDGESPAPHGESPALGDGESPAPRTSHSLESVNEPIPHTPASGGDESEKPKAGHEIKNADYTVEDLVNLYNEVCGEVLPRCNAINQSRVRAARKLSQLKLVSGKQPFIDGGLEAWKVYFAKAISNPFNTGNNDRAWKANFDYLMREAKALMILGI